MGVEQSNTSLVYDDAMILKVFRRLTEGHNPEVEVIETLAACGFAAVPEPLASWRRDDVDLAFRGQVQRQVQPGRPVGRLADDGDVRGVLQHQADAGADDPVVLDQGDADGRGGHGGLLLQRLEPADGPLAPGDSRGDTATARRARGRVIGEARGRPGGPRLRLSCTNTSIHIGRPWRQGSRCDKQRGYRPPGSPRA